MTIEKLAPLPLPTISEETPTDGSVKAVIDGVPFVYSEAGWIVDGHSASFHSRRPHRHSGERRNRPHDLGENHGTRLSRHLCQQPSTSAPWAQGDTVVIGGTTYTFNTDAGPPVTQWWSGATPTCYLPLAGGHDRRRVQRTGQRPRRHSLQDHNFWNVGAISVANPNTGTGLQDGQSGLFILTAQPTAWGTFYKFNGGSAPAPTSFPAVCRSM